MTANRKADLQRKLSLAPVPKPPAGLAERIKKEIPKQLRFNAEDERRNFSRSTAFSLRVAASVLILISAAYLGLQLLTRLDQQQPVAQLAARRPAAIRAEPQGAPLPQAAVPKLAAVKEEHEAGGGRRAAGGKERQLPVKIAESHSDVVAAAPAFSPPASPTPNVTTTVAAEVPAQSAMQKSVKAAVVARDQMNEADRGGPTDAEITTSPISGKQFLCVSGVAEVKNAKRITDDVFEIVEEKKTFRTRRDEKLQDLTIKPVPWKSASARTQYAILKAELARGGDRHAIARAAREVGLNALADEIEKP